MTQSSAKAKKGAVGFPVFAYPTSDATQPVQLFLIFRCKEKEGKATLCLRSSEDDAKCFILQFDPEHLTFGTSLRPTAILPHSQLTSIERPGNARIHTLSLKLKRCCTLWYPQSATIPPDPGLDIPFKQLVILAAATELEIVLDYCYVGHALQAMFKRLVDRPQSLCGYPVDRAYTKRFRRITLSECEIVGDVDADSTTDDELAPPPYVEASVKRARRVSTSPTPSYPPSKRVLFSLSPERTPASSTVKNSVATPSPKPPPLYPASALALRDDIFSAVALQLPEIVDGMLPSLLIGRLNTPSPLTSPFQSGCGDPTSQPPPSPKLSILGERLAATITKQVKQELQHIYTRAVSHAEWLCNTANDDILEELEDRKLDAVMMKDDVESEINRTATYKLEELREQVEEVRENGLSEIEQLVADACDDAKEHLNKLAQTERAWIQRESGWLKWQRETLERDVKKFEDAKRALDSGTDDDRGRRAQSASL